MKGMLLSSRVVLRAKLHIDFTDLLLTVYVILIHLRKSGGTAVTGAVDIPDRFRNDPLALFPCRIFNQNRNHAVIHTVCKICVLCRPWRYQLLQEPPFAL